MKTSTAILTLAACAAISACSTKNTEPPTHAGSETPQFEYQDDTRSYHSSWGHSGRGGAAVRKPAYQHVLATTDRLDVPVGRLYPHLSVASTAFPEGAGVGYHEPSAAILESMATCNHLHESEGNRIIASAREKTPAYIRVRNKLCAGTERLTYEEWQILVNGTPKDIPSHLKIFPSPSVSGATQHD